ncbi:MAG TPA: hypothetical protein VKD90_27105 [Gemmataceae bacterium]|nr:hypothetical protein [Gemmataceae bacterium]
MPITTACPNCDARLEAPDDIEGKKVQCKKCGEKFRARPVEEDDEDGRPARREARPASKSRPRPAAEDEDEDDRPSRRTGKASRRREDDGEDDRDAEEDQPRRRSRDEDDQEEEARPRKKKGKKKKKAGRPVVLFLSIGVGVLFLIAVIGAYFSSGEKSDPSAPTGGPVTERGGGAGAGGESAGHPDLPGWVEFADPNGQFKMWFPRKPAGPTKQPWPLASGDQAEVTIYTIEIGGGLWAVAHLIVPGREPGAPADPVLDEAIGGGMPWIKGAVIKSRTNITHQGFPGRQAVLEYPGVKGSTILRVILAGNRMFWVVARGENFAADTPKVRGFFDSLKIN